MIKIICFHFDSHIRPWRYSIISMVRDRIVKKQLNNRLKLFISLILLKCVSAMGRGGGGGGGGQSALVCILFFHQLTMLSGRRK